MTANDTKKTAGEEITPGEGPIREWFRDFLNLREGSDRESAVESIMSGKLMRGSNAWMLVCSIMIASLGLNLNSGAVIIGAMLISPLMNPILGVGLGVATNDKVTLWQALQNFGIAIAIALVTSTVYFWITPLDQFTEEMRARTAPTVLDGLVAIFGGLAGIISVTRKEKTSAIPGVAIATALMPPLCVSGYGLAIGNWGIAGRSFYLFFLNSFFIATTAYVIIRLLRFPYKKYLNKHDARRSQIYIGIISFIMIIPGFVILRGVLTELRATRSIEAFVSEYFQDDVVDYKLIATAPDSNLLVLQLVDHPMTEDSAEYYAEILREAPYFIPGANVRVIQDNSINIARLDRIQYELSSLDDLETKLGSIEAAQLRNVERVAEMQSELAIYQMDSVQFVKFTRQLQLAFPSVRRFHLARSQGAVVIDQRNADPTYVERFPLCVVDLARPNRRENPLGTRERRDQLYGYLKAGLEVDTLDLVIR